MPKKTVTLQPGESKEVVFTFTPTETRSYTVNVDGLVGSFRAIPLQALVELAIHAPDTMGVEQRYSVWATVRNIGNVTITFGWKFGLGDSVYISGQLQLEPGEISEVVRYASVRHSISGTRVWWLAVYFNDTEIARATKSIVIA